MKLSSKAFEVLKLLFSENSGLQLPVACVDQVIEIREWLKAEEKERETDTRIN